LAVAKLEGSIGYHSMWQNNGDNLTRGDVKVHDQQGGCGARHKKQDQKGKCSPVTVENSVNL